MKHQKNDNDSSRFWSWNLSSNDRAGAIIDQLFLEEDMDNILIEIEDHVRDMTPEYVRKDKLLY